MDNFVQRMDRLQNLNEDEYRRTTDKTVFQSKVIPIPHSETHNEVVNLYNVLVEVELRRRVGNSGAGAL